MTFEQWFQDTELAHDRSITRDELNDSADSMNSRLLNMAAVCAVYVDIAETRVRFYREDAANYNKLKELVGNY